MVSDSAKKAKHTFYSIIKLTQFHTDLVVGQNSLPLTVGSRWPGTGVAHTKRLHGGVNEVGGATVERDPQHDLVHGHLAMGEKLHRTVLQKQTAVACDVT